MEGPGIHRLPVRTQQSPADAQRGWQELRIPLPQEDQRCHRDPAPLQNAGPGQERLVVPCLALLGPVRKPLAERCPGGTYGTDVQGPHIGSVDHVAGPIVVHSGTVHGTEWNR